MSESQHSLNPFFVLLLQFNFLSCHTGVSVLANAVRTSLLSTPILTFVVIFCMNRKTLQTITTILDNRCKLQHSKPGAKHPPNLKGTELEDRVRESNLWDASLEEWKHEMKMVNVPNKMWNGKKQLGLRAGTLVICPVIAVTQWKAEIEKFTDGRLTIATYHGPNRAKELPLQKLIKYDIIITTYQVLEQDFRKMVSPNKVTCPNCGGKYKVCLNCWIWVLMNQRPTKLFLFALSG